MGVVLDEGPGSGPISLLDEWLGVTQTNFDFDSMIADMAGDATTVLDRDGLDFTDLVADSSYFIQCDADDVLTIPAGTVLSGISLISECPVRVEQDVHLQATVVIGNLAALRHVELSIEAPGEISITEPGPCKPGDGVQVLIFIDVSTSARFTLFDPEVYPLGDILVAANSHGVDADGPVDLGLNVDVIGELSLGTVVENLLGVCLGAQYMLEVDAYAYAR